jgi:hypothetical protein
VPAVTPPRATAHGAGRDDQDKHQDDKLPAAALVDLPGNCVRDDDDSSAHPALATTAGNPWRTLGYSGDHPEASRNLRFDSRTDRASVRPSDPNSGVIHRGINRGAGTPNARASTSKYSRCRTGSSSPTLYTPAGTPKAATTAPAASSCDTDGKNASAGPAIGAKPFRTYLARSASCGESGP